MNANGIFITGTDTGVGKTFVTAGLAAVLKSRLQQGIAIWKPVQSGAMLGSPDADSYLLRAGSGVNQEEQEIATYTFAKPLAPLIAAHYEGVEIDFTRLVEIGRARMAKEPFLFIEGAGGLAVPLTVYETVATLAQQLKLPLLVIARPGLGTVNHTLLTISYAQQLGLNVIGIILNHYTPEEEIMSEENAMMIEHFGGVPVIGKLPKISCTPATSEDWLQWREHWSAIIVKNVNIEHIMKSI